MRPAPMPVPTLAALIAASSLAVAATAVPADAAGVPATAGAAANATRAAGPVLSPRPGRVVRAHRVRIRVRSGDLPGSLRARLNGVAVGADFGPADGRGVRTLVTSVSHGLRRGRNVLRVTVVRSGQPPRRAAIRFTVRTRRALTGAGRDRRIAIGAQAPMSGRALALPRGSRVSARWRVVAGPGVRGTRAVRLRTRTRGARGAAAADTTQPARPTPATGTSPAQLTPPVLTSPAGLEAGFRPVVPGTYTLRLTSGSGAASSSDEVTLTAVPPTPLVPFDTMAGSGGQRGIRVGDTTYLLRDASGRPQSTDVTALHVVVLERATLSPVSNKAYDELSDARRDLDALDDDSQLVIVSLQPNPGALNDMSLDGLERTLVRVGFPAAKLPRTPGSLSGVGVPGMKPGDADVSVAPLDVQFTGRQSTYGRMQGYLSPDQYANYGFVASERVPFRYVAPDSPCGAGASCAGSVGFRVLVHDWKTLAPARGGDGIVYQTGRPGLTRAQQNAEVQSMVDNLASVEDGNLVIVQAVSTRSGDGYLPPVGEIDRAWMAVLSAEIAKLGGTRHAFNSIARRTGPGASGGSTYTLVGWKGAGEGEGAEVAANVDGVGDAPALTGVLRPDRQSHYRPAEVAESARSASELASLVLAEPTKGWPLSDPGHARALAHLGSTQRQLGSDPRTAYWTMSLTESDTTAIATALGRAAYPRGADFTAQEFADAQDQLVRELGWVGNVRSYVSKLQQPFSEGQLGQWATAQTVADQVLEDARRPDDEVTLEWLDLTKELLDLLGPATEEVTGVLGGLLDVGMWAYGATKSGGPGADEMRVHADQLGRALVDRAEQAKATLDAMGDVIVSDYAKLQKVGTYGGCNPASDDCPPYLALLARDVARNKVQIARSAERLAYQKLLPLGYNVMQLAPGRTDRDFDSWGPQAPKVERYACGPADDRPWRGYPRDASAARLHDLDPTGRFNAYDMFVLARPPGIATTHGTPPPDDVLERMFGPVSRSQDPRAGGLGMEPGPLMVSAEKHWWYSDAAREAAHCTWLPL